MTHPPLAERETNLGVRLEGKVAIITGAGRGLGRAEALAAEGAKVVENVRRIEGYLRAETHKYGPRYLPYADNLAGFVALLNGEREGHAIRQDQRR